MRGSGRGEGERRGDNRGVTLLELVIAVAIFSIAAMALLQSFVTSGRVNKKSRVKMEGTAIAQNMMEEIKSRSFPELCAAFNYPKSDSFSSLPEGDFREVTRSVVNGETVYNGVTRYNETFGENTDRVTASVVSTDEGHTFTFHPREKGENASRYWFEAAGVQGDTMKFDVLAEFDGSASSGYKKASSREPDEKNDYELPNIEKLSTQSNAFLIIGEHSFDEALKEMTEEQHNYAAGEAGDQSLEILDTEELRAHTRRIIEIKVKKEASGIITASARTTLCAYSYTKALPYETMTICPCGGRHVDDRDNEANPSPYASCFCTVVGAWSTFYSSTADQTLEGVYLFYHPNYGSTSSSSPLDEIVLFNEDNIPLRFFVTKQKKEGAADVTSAMEIAYRMSLTVKEQPESANWNTNPSLYRSATELRTNLDQDITTDQRDRVSQMNLSYQDTSPGRVKPPARTNQAKKILNVNGIDNKSASDRIYRTTVRVYLEGAEAKNYPEDMLVASLEGAKEQ